MSFESGSLSFRMYYVEQAMPKDVVERLAARQAPPIKSMGTEPIHGWIGGRHLMDTPVTEENTHFGGYLRAGLLKAEKKVPAATLQAECRLEEQAHMKAENKPFVDRKTRSEIRKNILARLLPTMPPSLKATWFIYEPDARIIFATSTSESASDAFRIHFRNALGFDPVPVSAETAAEKLGLSARDWGKSSFSPEVPDSAMDENPGMDFITWLWFASEARGGLFELADVGKVGLMIDGPLSVSRAGEGAHVVTLKDGLPTISAEAECALLAGKKLVQAKMALACTGDENWRCTFNASEWLVRGLKLPESKEMLDAASEFQSRIQNLNKFYNILMGLFAEFAKERADAASWKKTQGEIHQWVRDRKSKK